MAARALMAVLGLACGGCRRRAADGRRAPRAANWSSSIRSAWVFASSGALLAVRRGLDVLAGVVLGGATALGGGILRDVILGEVPPAALREVSYLLTAVVVATATYFLHGRMEPLRRPFVLLDAAELALFCVTGTFRTLDADLLVLSAVLLGALTAVGGACSETCLSAKFR